MSERLRIKNKREFLKVYEKTALSYDRARSGSFQGRTMDKFQRNLIYNLIKEHKCKKILEAGCGTGRILLFLASKGLKCHGIDPSKNMLSLCKEKLKATKSKIELKKGDIEKIPYKSNTFDCTYTMHVLMHMPDYKKAFKEMHRVTKKKGIIICDFPNKNSPWTKISLFLNPEMKRTQLFTIKELEKFFGKYNYTMTGLFSYARTFYKIPIIRYIILFLEHVLPLPLSWKTQLIVIVKK